MGGPWNQPLMARRVFFSASTSATCKTDRQTRTRTHTSLEHEIKTKIVKKKKIPQGSASKTLVVLFRFSHKQRTIQELQQFLVKFGVTTEKNQLSPPQGLN